VVAAALLTGCSAPDDAAPAPTSAPASSGAGSQTPEPPAVTTATLTADGIELLLTVPLGPGGDDATSDNPTPADGTSSEGEALGGAPAGSPVTVVPDEDGSNRVTFAVQADVPEADGPEPGSAARAGSGAETPATGSAGTDEDGSSGAGTASAPTATPATIDLVSPADGSLLRNGDGSLTVLDAAGTPLGGFSAPQATDGSGVAGSAGFLVVAPHRAEVHGKRPGATSSGPAEGARWTVTTWLGARGVRSATWGEREGGRSLAVDPTPWARQSGIVGEATAWAQLVAAEPEAGTTTMRDQFDCHALGATDKKTWNLEPWRPDVGFLATAAARCNPT
jgi:hypothetical protein